MSSTTARKRALLLLIFVAQASTFSPPFPTLEVVSNKPECRDVYDTCMSTFRECLTSTSLAESCEEYRGNVCEGMVRVRCDKLVEVAVEDEYSDSDGEEATSHYTSVSCPYVWYCKA